MNYSSHVKQPQTQFIKNEVALPQGAHSLCWKDIPPWQGEEGWHTVGKAGGKTARYGNRMTEEEEVNFETPCHLNHMLGCSGNVVMLERGRQQGALTGEPSKTSKRTEIC